MSLLFNLLSLNLSSSYLLPLHLSYNGELDRVRWRDARAQALNRLNLTK